MKFLKGSSSSSSSNTSPSKSDQIDFSKELDKTNDLICQIINWLKENNVQDKYGVFRESGEKQVKETILKSICFKKSAYIDLSKYTSDDVLSVANVMKEVLRSMSQPLLVSELYNEFISITKINDYLNKILVLKILFYSLPQLNREIVFNIFEFLSIVHANSANNMMTPLNLATVFAPNILISTGVSQFELLEHSNLIINIINLLIDEFPFISNKTSQLTQTFDNKYSINDQKEFLTEYQSTHLKSGNIILKDDSEGGVSVSSFKSPFIKVYPFYVNEELNNNNNNIKTTNTNTNINSNNINVNKKILTHKPSLSGELIYSIPLSNNNQQPQQTLSPTQLSPVQHGNSNKVSNIPTQQIQSSSPTSPLLPLSPTTSQSLTNKLNSLSLSPPSPSVNKPPPLTTSSSSSSIASRILPSISGKPPVPSQHTKPTHSRSQSASPGTTTTSSTIGAPIPLHSSQSRTPPPLPSRSQSTSLLNHPPPISISPVNNSNPPVLTYSQTVHNNNGNGGIGINRTQSSMSISPSQQRRVQPQPPSINHTQSSISLMSTPPSTPPPLPPSSVSLSNLQQSIPKSPTQLRPTPPIPNRSLSSSTIDSNQNASPKPISNINRPVPPTPLQMTQNNTIQSNTPPPSLSSSSENLTNPNNNNNNTTTNNSNNNNNNNNNNTPPNRPPPPTPPSRTQNNSLYQPKNLPSPIFS